MLHRGAAGKDPPPCPPRALPRQTWPAAARPADREAPTLTWRAVKGQRQRLSLIHISEPTRLALI
eukprot:7587938-Alexandrium_andersonii.AAC.1